VQCTLQLQDASRRLPLLQSWLSHSKQQLTSMCIVPKDERVAGFGWRSTHAMGTLKLQWPNLARLQELILECIDLDFSPTMRPQQQQRLHPSSQPGDTAAAATSLGNLPIVTVPVVSQWSPLSGVSQSSPLSGSAYYGSSDVHPLLPSLQRLDLKHVALDTIQCLVQLAQSPVLTSLQLDDVQARDAAASWLMRSRTESNNRATSVSRLNEAMASLLEGLPGLQVLAVQAATYQKLHPTVLHSITAMHNLQQLIVELWSPSTTDQWPGALPQQLTRLHVTVNGGSDVITPAVTTWPACLDSMQRMQQLQDLKLQRCKLDPALLSSITGLRMLHLDSCELVPGIQAGTRTLLQTLQGLTQMQEIHLILEPGSTHGLALELFGALTASAQLTCLKMAPFDDQPLPRGAVRHMFPAKCSKPQLQVLQLKNDFVEPPYDDDTHDWCLGDRDLALMAAACRGLTKLELMRVVRPGATAAGLQRLPGSLSSLSVGGLAFGDAAAAAVAHLTQLQSLEWDNAVKLSDVGFQRLTTLTGLTRLYCDGFFSDLSEDLFGGSDDIDNRTIHLCSTSLQVCSQFALHCPTVCLPFSAKYYGTVL
jgi:hypothetical protein